MCVNESIIKFRNFLLIGWEAISFYQNFWNEKEEIINDFLQANWEILVENSLCSENEFLEVYGYGADCNGASSRVCYPNKIPTHRIICNPINNKPVRDVITNTFKIITGMSFDGFLSSDGKSYHIQPPIDHILLNISEETILVELNNISFNIQKISNVGIS